MGKQQYGLLKFLLLFAATLALLPLIVSATACTNNYLGNTLGQGGCVGSITFTHSNTLLGEVNVSGDILVSTGVVLTSNSQILIAGNAIINSGNVFTGNPNNGGARFNTGTGCGGQGCTGGGGNGAYGIYLQAPYLSPGYINANGIFGTNGITGTSGQNEGGGGGGGGSLLIFAYSTTYVAGTYNVLGGVGGAGAAQGGGGTTTACSGGSTLAAGGTGGNGAVGNPGSNVLLPVLTNANIIIYVDAANTVTNTLTYLAAAGGGSGVDQASSSDCNAGTGFAVSYGASGAGGGGNLNSPSSSFAGGTGGNGQVRVYQWGSAPLVTTPAPTLSISPNPASYGQQVQITYTPVPLTDNSNIIVQGSTVLTGTGAITYNALGTPIAIGNSLAVGTYNVNGCDTTLNTCVGTTVLTINKATPTNTLATCSNSALPFTCTTTATISTLGNVISVRLFLGSNQVASGTSSASDIETNAIYNYAYTANSLGNGNYLTTSLTASYSGYIPLVFQNITGATLTSRNIAPPQNTIPNTFPPVELTTATFNGATYDLTQSINFGANTALSSGIANILYVVPSNTATGNIIFSVTEHQFGNIVIVGANVNLFNANQVVSSFTCNSPLVQYDPNQCNLASTAFQTVPGLWKLASDPAKYTHSNVTNTIWVTAENTILPVNVYLSYNQFSPTIAYNITISNNPMVQKSLTFNAFTFLASNAPSGLNSWLLIATNSLSEGSSQPFNTMVNSLTTFVATVLLNNFTIPLSVKFNSTNSVVIASNVYATSSNFGNPPVSLLSQFSTTVATNYAPRVNNPFDTNLIYPNNELLTFYNPVSAQSTGFTISVYACGGYATNDSLALLYGASLSQSTRVQLYKMAQIPFIDYMLTGFPYGFSIYATNGTLVYTSPFSSWGNPITIYSPCTSSSTPTLLIPNVTLSCKSVSNAAGNLIATCTGSDSNKDVSSWKINFVNQSTLLTLSVWNTVVVNGASFTASNTLPSNTVGSYYAQIWYTTNGLFDAGTITSSILHTLALNPVPQKPLTQDYFFVAIFMILLPAALAYFNRVGLLLLQLFVVIIGQALGIFGFSVGDVTGFIIFAAILIILDEASGR